MSSSSNGSETSVEIEGTAASVRLGSGVARQTLHVGLYENAVRIDVSGAGRPSLDVNLYSSGCSGRSLGWFYVHDIQWAETKSWAEKKTVTRLLLTFEQKCDDGRIRRGCLRYTR